MKRMVWSGNYKTSNFVLKMAPTGLPVQIGSLFALHDHVLIFRMVHLNTSGKACVKASEARFYTPKPLFFEKNLSKK